MSDVKVPGFVDGGDGIHILAKTITALRPRNGAPEKTTYETDDGAYLSNLHPDEFARRLAEALAEGNGAETPKGSQSVTPELRKSLNSLRFMDMADMDEYRLCRIFVEATDLGSTGHGADLAYADELRDKVVKVLKDRIQRAYDQGREAGRKEASEPPPPTVADSPDAGQGVEEEIVEVILSLVRGFATSTSHSYWKDAREKWDGICTRLRALAGPRKVRVRVCHHSQDSRFHWIIGDGAKSIHQWYGLSTTELAMDDAIRCLAPLGLVPEFVE